MKIPKIKLKQNWVVLLFSKLCNRNKKDVFPTVNIPYDEVKQYIHKAELKLYVPINDDEVIKSRLSNKIANYIIENNLIQYTVKERISSIDNTFESFLIESNFLFLTNKNTENENPKIS